MSMNMLLFAAIRRGALGDVESILDTDKADVNARDEGGWTPLMRAAADNNVDIVRLLLRYGADPRIKDAKGLTVASLAGPEVKGILNPLMEPEGSKATVAERHKPPTDMAGATELVLRCKALKPFSAEERKDWQAILAGLGDLTEDKAHAGLLLAEVLGALDDSPAAFRLLLRDVGIAHTRLHFEIATTHLCYHYEFMEAMSDSWQSSECKHFVTDLRGLPADVSVSVQSDHALYPTYTVTLRGLSQDAAERAEKAVRRLFARVRRSR
ncbi:MAG: ankyrin repeat domain-containing protein [Chloroflexota bacterium]|nr:ankyrin repeat domain-containing protein [Chloroflexota bacterium]